MGKTYQLLAKLYGIYDIFTSACLETRGEGTAAQMIKQTVSHMSSKRNCLHERRLGFGPVFKHSHLGQIVPKQGNSVTILDYNTPLSTTYLVTMSNIKYLLFMLVWYQLRMCRILWDFEDKKL